VPAPLGIMGLVALGVELFGLFAQPAPPLVCAPHVDLGLDRIVGQPHKHNLHRDFRLAQRLEQHPARRLRFDRALDVRAFQRKLTC